MRYNSKSRVFGEKLVAFVLGALFLAPVGVATATIYSSGTLLQPGDVTSEHILNDEIVNADIDSSAAISATKIAGGGTGGHLVFSASSQLGTSTALSFATSTNTLSLTGTLAVTGTTTIDTVSYNWPNSQGSANTVLQNDGSGNLSWASAAASKMSAQFTAGETITAGEGISLGFASSSTYSYGGTGTNQQISNISTDRVAQRFTSPAAVISADTLQFNYTQGSSEACTLSGNLGLYADDGGEPATSALGSGSTGNLNGSGTGFKSVSIGTVSLSPSTNYWVVLYVTQDTCSFNMQFDRGNSAGQNTKISTDSGSSYSDQNGGMAIRVSYTNMSTDRVYRSSGASSNSLANAFIGIAQTTVSAGATVVVDIGGLSTATTTLTAGTTYYLCNAEGQLCTSAGSQSRKVGLGLGSLGFLIKSDNP